MPKNIVLHDRRLEGSAPIGRSVSTLRVDAATPLSRVFVMVQTLWNLDGIQRLYILCHGFAGGSERAALCGDFGGMGLQLTRDNVVHENVHRWRCVRGCLSEIIVYSCGAADTQPENVGSSADGKYLMGALALHSGATVYAADRIQWYHTGNISDGTIRFGSWEGTLFKFDPGGGFGPAAGNRVPIEATEA
jgi:hypothetical protein